MPGEYPRAAVSSRKEEMVTWAGVVAVGIDWNSFKSHLVLCD